VFCGFNKRVWEFVRTNGSVRGKQNLTTAVICSWVNEVLLVNNILEPGDGYITLGFRSSKKRKALMWMAIREQM